MQQTTKESSQADAGLMASIAAVARNGLGLLVNRIELAALELAEVRNNFFKILSIIVLGAVTAWFATACWIALIVVLSWQTLGWKILLILAGGFTLLAIGVFFYVRALLDEGRLSMPATLAELRSDRDTFMH